MPNNTFAPYTEEKKILIKVTLKEAHLIKMMRLVDYGNITVYKANKQVLRVESNKSIILNDIEGKDIEYRFDNQGAVT
jgi:hypothetical protein